MKKILSTRVLVKICVLTTILLVLIIYTIWGNSALMVSMVNISSDRIASAFSNFRIAQVSDLHNAEFGESNTELIELLSEHEPDIIVITGDLIDAGHTDIEIAFDFVKQAVQIAPVYFVTGNHEANFSHYDQFKTGLEASGVTVLEDEAIQLVHNNEMITLIGLSDSDFTIKGDMFNEAPAMVTLYCYHIGQSYLKPMYAVVLIWFYVVMHTEGSFDYLLLGGSLPPIKGCFLNMIPAFIQTE